MCNYCIDPMRSYTAARTQETLKVVGFQSVATSCVPAWQQLDVVPRQVLLPANA